MSASETITYPTAPTDTEIDELAAFLKEHCYPNGGMDISTLDGYMTAVVSGPILPPMSEWLPAVFGKTVEFEVQAIFRSPEEAVRIHTTIIGRFNEIGRMLDEKRFIPIFAAAQGDARRANKTLYGDLWCVGYTRGMVLREAAWDALVDRAVEESVLLTPIFALALPMMTAEVERDKDQAIAAMLRSPEPTEIAAYVPDAAEKIYRFWRERRSARRTFSQGRNEPCSCGSGKKHKKCCGA
jgi:uncharacterized protein